jgi:hypothetical protein
MLKGLQKRKICKFVNSFFAYILAIIAEGKHGAFYFIMLFHFSSSGFVHNMMLLLQGWLAGC